MDSEMLLTGKQASEYMGVSQSVITRLANIGKLHPRLVGSRRIYMIEDLDSYLRENNLTSAPRDHERTTTDLPEITAISFFSGAGGLDYGMELAGIRSLLYCENNRECRMTLNQNRPNAALIGDISKVTPDEVLKMAKIPEERGVDIMFGGPPCQAFSTAGARRAFNDARGNVFLSYLELAKQLRPRYLVIENVRGLLSTPYPLREDGDPVHGGALKIILERLRNMGYAYSFNLYNAANFGAPQIRERVVIIAKRDGRRMPWLTPNHSDDSSWGLPRWVTFRDAVASIESREQHYVQFPAKRLKYFEMLHEGQCWTSLPKKFQAEAMGKAYDLPGGKTGFYRRIQWDRPSPTLVTSPTMKATDLCHPSQLRPLSVEEYRAVQGFPDEWKIAGNLSDIYRQVGNAVPVALGKAIGRAILDDMSGNEIDPRWENFPYSRYNHTSDLTWSEPCDLT